MITDKKIEKLKGKEKRYTILMAVGGVLELFQVLVNKVL